MNPMMKPGAIIEHYQLNPQTKLTICYPQKTDAPALMTYINDLSRERTFVSYQGEQISLKEEEKYLQGLLKKMREKDKQSVLALDKDRIVAHFEVTRGERTEKHIGIFGAGISQGYRNQGLGTYLLALTGKLIPTNLPDIEILQLKVHADNDRGIHLYKKMGFVESGRLPRGVKLENRYEDLIYMYKNLQR
jgi:ribosomal protein S18 acetylase RimI-like enzyme